MFLDLQKVTNILTMCVRVCHKDKLTAFFLFFPNLNGCTDMSVGTTGDNNEDGRRHLLQSSKASTPCPPAVTFGLFVFMSQPAGQPVFIYCCAA